MLDLEGKGEIDFKDMRYMNDQLKYGMNEQEIVDKIHEVGGYNADTITFDKYNSHVRRQINRRRDMEHQLHWFIQPFRKILLLPHYLFQ